MIDFALLIVAGIGAGTVGAAGGIMSLVSYPVLLATGLPALNATVANNVVGIAVMPGSMLGSRGELRGRSGFLRRWLPLTALGGGAGSALLLLTPAHLFGRLVPFLVAAGALALLLQPRMTSWHQRRGRHGELLLAAGLTATSVYAGYFGAGTGVMALTLILILVEHNLPKANALKNVLVGVPTLVTAIAMVIFSHVAWGSAIPLMIGIFLGAAAGPAVARRMPHNLLRWAIVLLGFTLAVKLWVSP